MLPLGTMMLLASVSSWAQTPAPAEGKTLETVTIKEAAEAPQNKDVLQTRQTSIGKGTQDIRDIPQSITVVTERLIDDTKVDNLKQALHHVAGITFAATENGTDQDIRMRGFPVATTGDLLIDGMKDPSQYERDTFNYDRIEVMRGSASMIFGRGSTGGVINQVNKKPLLIDQHDIDTTVGTAGLFRTTADLNKRIGEEAAFRLNLMYQKADNGGAKIDKYGLAPTFSWGVGSRDEFSVGLFHLDVDNTPRSAIRYLQGTVPTLNPKDFYGTRSDYLTGKATYGMASWIHRFDDNSQLTTRVRTGTFDRAQWGTTAGFGTTNGQPTTLANLGGNTILTRSGLSPRQDSYDATYLQSDYSTKAEWFGMKHELLTGVDAAFEKANRYSAYGAVGTNYNKGNTTVGTPNDGRITDNVPTYRNTSNYDGQAFGVYAQDLVQVAPHWKLLGGLRWDRFSADMDQLNYAANGSVSSKPSSRLRYSSLWSYRAGALYQPSEHASYHVSYSTSFNTSADTYQYTNQTNANTPAEKSRNFEVGAKLDWLDGKLSTRVAAFRTEKFNERTTDSDFANEAYLLTGARHSAGLEFDIVGRLTPQWETYFSYSWTPVARITKAGSSAAAQATVGQRVGLTPKHSGSIWLSYQATPELRVAGGIHGASQNRPLSGATGAASATARAPGYVVGDVMVEYRINETFTTQLNVSNITNRTYGDQLYPGFVVLGEPRVVKLTLSARF